MFLAFYFFLQAPPEVLSTVWASPEVDQNWIAPPLDMLTVEEAAGDFVKPGADDVAAMMKYTFANPKGADGAEKLVSLFGHGCLLRAYFNPLVTLCRIQMLRM